jgi:hypothetical protein
MAIQLSFLVTNSSASETNPEIIVGCQGEGCNCLREYGAADKMDFDIVSIRSFTLYKSMSEKSKKLGEFKAGTKGTPSKRLILITDPGEYVVTKIHDRIEGLNVGDHVNTLIYLGEGTSKFRKNTNWISFSEEQITIKKIRPTKFREWMKVSIGTIHGYTTEYPFEGCLE